jgi:hypothetical protein
LHDLRACAKLNGMSAAGHPLEQASARAWLVALALVIVQGAVLAWGFLVLQ